MTKLGRIIYLEPEKLLRSGYDVANPDAILFGSQQSRWIVPESVSLAMLTNKNHVHTCAAFRRSYWAEVGGIDENLSNWQDYEFWIRLAKSGARIKRLPGDHFYYRRHQSNKSIISIEKQKSIQQYINKKHATILCQVKVTCHIIIHCQINSLT